MKRLKPLHPSLRRAQRAQTSWPVLENPLLIQAPQLQFLLQASGVVPRSEPTPPTVLPSVRGSCRFAPLLRLNFLLNLLYESKNVPVADFPENGADARPSPSSGRAMISGVCSNSNISISRNSEASGQAISRSSAFMIIESVTCIGRAVIAGVGGGAGSGRGRGRGRNNLLGLGVAAGTCIVPGFAGKRRV